MLIGITGLIGSGKSEVARIFKKHGACVISADQIGKEVVENNKSLLNKLASIFGRDILTPRGNLRRRKLGERAFSSKSNRDKLNTVVHPYLLKELARQSKQALKKYKIVVIDAALLIFWGWHDKVDLTILVHAGRDIRLSRFMAKGYGQDEFNMRTLSQLSYTAMRKGADMVIMNNKSLESLEVKVKKILKKIA